MAITEHLKDFASGGSRFAILGVGSVLRSDDAAGMHLIDLLSGLSNQANVLLIKGSTAPENFTGLIKQFGPDRLLIIDAAHLGLLPGEAIAITPDNITGISFATHQLPLPVMIKYLASEIRCDVLLIGIQPESTEFGEGLSQAVKAGVSNLAQDFMALFAASCSL